MLIIIGLVVVGALLTVAELVLLPGLSVAAFCALGAYGGAVYMAFARYGNTAGFTVLAAVVVVTIVATILSLRAKTWQRFSLKQSVDSSSREMPEASDVRIGDRGMTVGRLAPMGKVLVAGKTLEAKSVDAYIDPDTEVEVTGFENFNIIVKKTTNN